MLDTAASVPVPALLERPTILELDAMGDDDDKAFLMGLLLVRLVQHRRTTGATSRLRHMLVIEESHRLLSARGPRASQEEADPKGKVVEMFSNLLSEVRAYGQGIVIADQVPVRLAPDALKNTGLKIAHRTVANDDREALGGAMAMSKEQEQRLASLPTGRAATFGDGDDAPVLLQMPETKERLLAERPSDVRVADHMAGWRREQNLESVFTTNTGCTDACRVSEQGCRAARQLAEDPIVQRCLARMLLSTLDDPAALDRLWPDLVEVVRARPADAGAVAEKALLAPLAGHGAQWFADHRGAQAGWSYEDTDELAALASRALAEKVDSDVASGDSPARRKFVEYARVLHRRTYAP